MYVDREVHCQTNRGQELKKIRKGAPTFPMYKPVFYNGTKKKKVVIDCESSKN